jgi:hypothetical protein
MRETGSSGTSVAKISGKKNSPTETQANLQKVEECTSEAPLTFNHLIRESENSHVNNGWPLAILTSRLETAPGTQRGATITWRVHGLSGARYFADC